ncbi:MAG: right-handed parallel beta-helix repeat-containing protein, partial [Saprospiraceae bacterium]|nr:right-handed parallel beta-helix repeat-containing protein [Saprospiraceae bacterium]
MTKSIRLSAALVAMLLVNSPAFSNTYTVTNTLDDNNPGSLRYAVNQANANAGADDIVFNITGTGPFSIAIGSTLTLTGPTVIDGSTQPGFMSGTQSTYVKVGTAFTGTIFSATNVTGITIKGLDLSYSSPRQGAGIGFSNCNQTFILGNFIRNRRTGISLNGGQDHTVQNNNLLASGENTGEPCVYLGNITPGSIAGGIAMSGNKFGGNANMGFRFDNMNNLVIGDASVSGAHIVIEDTSGFTAMGTAGQFMLWFNTCNNITIDNVDLSWLGGGVSNSHGIIFSNAVTNSTFTVKNCSIKNRYGGISAGNGKDITIQNNDLRGSGHEGSYAVSLSNITEANVNGGILMSGNTWGRNTGVAESYGGLRISNTNNLTIGDASTGIQIKLEDNSGLNTVLGNESGSRGALFLENVSNITIDNIDASWAPGGLANAFGIRVNNTGSNGSITIKNCDVRNRHIGIVCQDGKDYTVTGNDLRGSGHENNYAMYLLNIAEGMIPGGVLVHNNLWGRNTGVNESHSGLYIADMSNLVIGDAATGVHIKIEDNSGFNTILGNEGTYRGALLLERVSNITVDNVDASWSLGGITNSFGIFVQNETSQYSGQTTSHRNVTIKNCDFRNRGMGIRIRGGKDYTVTGNDLRGCGEHGHHALQLINIQSGTMTGGILAHTNLFGTGAAAINNGIYIQQMNDLSIGDAATGGNIKIEDNSGLNQIVGNDVNNRGSLYLNQVGNVTLNSVDCSYATGGQAGNSWGIRVANTASNSNISIINCNAGNRGRGIWVDNGRDYTITGNNLVGSGNGSPALELSNIIPGSLTGGILAGGNTFGTPNFKRGVVIQNMRNLLIGDENVAGANIILEDACGLNLCQGDAYNNFHGPLYLGGVDNVTVDGVDCSKSTAGQGGSYAIYVANGANNQNVTIKNCKADNRQRGIYCSGGKDYTVQNNTITNSGSDGEACALDFRNVTAGTLTGGVLVSGNTFGNVPITANTSRAGVRFDNMRDLYISDGYINSNVKLEDGSGLTAVGFDLNSSYVVLNLNNVSNSTVDNLDLSYTGTNQNGNAIRLSNGASQGTVTIKNCTINKRRLGIYIGGGRDYTITGNNLTGTGQNSSNDINNGGPAVWLNGLVKGSLDGGIAMSGNTFGGTNANGALRIDDMRGFSIGDAVSDDIVLEDGTSGLPNVGNNATSNEFVLYLRQIADVTLNSVDLARAGGSQLGGGIRVDNGNGNKTVSLTNNSVGNRRTGIYISGGSDYTVTGNTLTGSGQNDGEPALYLGTITPGALPGGLSVSGNTFGGTNANTAVRFENLEDIVIGDASVMGRNVTFENGTSGLTAVGNNATSNETVLLFSNVTNSSINSVNLTRTGGTQYGRGIYVANGNTAYPFSITNCAVGNRRTGIYLAGGRDFNVQNNTLTGSGNNATEPALYLGFLTVNSNLVINNNTFGGSNFHTGIRVESTSDLLISDGTVSGTHLGVTTANGLGNATGYALYLANINRMKIQNMDLSFTTATKTGVGIQVTTNGGSTSLVEMKSLIVKNRVDGINIASGSGHSVKCSDLSDNTDGLEVASGVTSFACEQNSFVGNTNYAINSTASITAENNYFGGGAPPVGTPNGVTANVDATPFLAAAPVNCPTTLAAYLELKGNQNLVLNGSTTPSTANYTDFGSVKTGTPITRAFTINNTGGVALNVTSISFAGGNAGDFSAGALTPASPVPAGGSATFTITFTPGAVGLRSTTLTIANSDPNNNPFTAALQGTGKNVLVVTKTDDTNDGVCDADCSLREAITVANSNADADVIEFNIGGGGAQTITHTTAFPNITQPLTIDGSSQPGFAGTPLITINSNGNFTTFNALSVTGLTIKYLDISRPLANYDGNGIVLSSCNEVFILNNLIKNRYLGILSSGGRDHTIQNNDLRQTGGDSNNPAIYLSGLTSRDVPGGIKMSGNLFGDATGNNRSRFGIRINTMNNLLIGDASVANAHITIEDLSGMASTGTGDNYCLYLNNVSNTTVDDLDLTATTYGYQGWGIVVGNSASYGSVTIKNCKINNRYAGIYCSGGRDYTIQNNDLQKTGNDASRPSLWFQNVTPGALATGILANGNLFGDAGGLTRTGLRVDNASGLLIGNQTVPGAHITIEDNSGMKAAGSGDNYAVYLLNVSSTTVDKLDLTSTIGYQGWGLVVGNSANNSNVTIQNCKINGRYSGIYCIGGKDYTILNNDLKNTGNDNTRAALYLSGIRPGTLPAGVTAGGNLFGFISQTAKTALRVDGMDGLLIGDASVLGAHIVIEDASGANTMSTDGDNAVIYLNAVSNLTVNNVDVSRSAAGRSGVGIWVENSGNTLYRNLSILNCKMQQRDMSLYVSGGKDVTVTNNDMRYSGFYQDRPALYLTNIQSGTLPGGVSLSGNTFGGTSNSATSQSGIRMDNMRDLVMADAAAPGVNIVLEDNCGLNDVYGDDVSQRGVMYMNNVRNVQMSSIDLSKMTAGQGNSYALKVNNGINVSVLNGKGSNRYHGYYFEGGRDHTVTGNNLTGSGNQRDYPALRFSNIQPGSINTANGVAAAGNTFGGANVRTGLRIDNMKNLLIGDASVGGANIVIEDTSGLNNITQGDGNSSDHPAIFLSTVSDITVDNVDASRASGQDMGGIWVSNSITNSNVTIKNCNFNRHRRAIYCTGGRDYTIQNNTLLNCGATNDQPAIYLQNIQQGSLTGGILMSGNTFGGTSSFGGIRFENMRDLSIGDASTGGNVKLEDNSGFNNLGGNAGGNSAYYVLHFVNVNNATVDNVDLARPVGATPAQDFTGIRIDNGAAYGPITIKDCDISRHRTGISAQNGKDYTVTGNDLRGCGAGSEDPALYFNNITQQDGTVPMGILASTNTFGTVNSVVSNCALRLDNLCGIRISDGTVPNSHIKIAAAGGIKEVTGTGGNYPAVITMLNTSGMAVEKLDLEFTGSQTGTGIRFQNSNASQYDFSIKDNILKNRRMGVYIINGADYTITGNNFSMTGAADDEPAIRMEHVAEGTLYGGVSMSGNTFGGTGAAFGLKFVNMSNLKISDGTYPGTNVNLGAWATNGIGNLTTGNALHLSGICNATVSTLDLSRSGTTRQGVGLRLSNGMGNTIEKVFVQGRDAGIQINGTASEAIQCNVLYDNNFGFDFVNNAAIRSMTFQNNSMHCNTTALRNQLPASFGALNAQSNYWGTATGPTNLGGTGNGYTNTNGGSVNATSFLTAAAACAPALPNADALGNNVVIEDGDMSPAINDNTLVCGTDVGQTLTATYSIKNNGTGTIRLDGASPVSISPASPVFSVGSQPADLELAAGESTTFTINFTPNALGTFTANVNIENRTCDNDPYNFTVQGQGCTPYTATLSGTPAICAGQSAMIALDITGGQAPFTVTLSDGSTHTVNATGSSNLTVSPSMTTAYTITSIYDANNCCATNAGSATVTVHPLPTPAIAITETSGNTNHDGILCSGASATLDAGVFTMYAWTPAGNTQTIIATVAGTYTVTVTDGNGCQNTASATIVVNPNPTPTITETDNSGTANDNIICAGGTATLDAGGGYTTYAWMPSGNMQTRIVSAGDTYTVVVTDANGCTGTDDQAIQENALPVAVLSGALLVCPGTTSAMINLNITAGVAPFTVVLSDASSHNVAASGMSQLSVTVAGPAT